MQLLGGLTTANKYYPFGEYFNIDISLLFSNLISYYD